MVDGHDRYITVEVLSREAGITEGEALASLERLATAGYLIRLATVNGVRRYGPTRAGKLLVDNILAKN